MAGVPIYIVHLSCADALEKVKQARDMGLPAYAETCPQYLFLSYDDYEREGFEGAKYVMSPPLREKWHQDVLWKGLLRNDLQVVSTDHCPFCMNEPPQKQLGADDFSRIPNGAPGIETRLMLIWEGVRARRIDIHRFVELVVDEPGEDVRPLAAQGHDRRGLRRRPRGVGSRQAGDALGRRRTTCAWTTTPTKAASSPARPPMVLSRGEVIVDHGEFKGRVGRGRVREARRRAAARLKCIVDGTVVRPTAVGSHARPERRHDRRPDTWHVPTLLRHAPRPPAICTS